MTSLSTILLLLFSLNYSSIIALFPEQNCRGSTPGDCDPNACGGPCESRYIRFHDQAINGDRTVKSCQCLDEKVCSIPGISSETGCRSYVDLGNAGQRMIRLWSMDSRDRRNRHSNSILQRYSDKIRHQQLINGNSLFCCRLRRSSKKQAMYLKSATSTSILPFISISFLYLFLI